MAEDYRDYILDSAPAVEATDWTEVAALLEASQEQHQDRLETELAAIEHQLEERDRLHQQLVEELERKIGRYVDRLDHLYTIGKGRLDGTRDRLKDRLEHFYQELRAEHRTHWQDRQQLEQERRELRRELAAATDESLAEFL